MRMRWVAFLIVALFVFPLAAFGECEEETTTIPMDATALGGGHIELRVPSVLGDLRNLHILDVVMAIGPNEGQVGWMLTFGFPTRGTPVVVLLLDYKGYPRAIAIIVRTARRDWLYEEGCPVRASPQEVLEMIDGMEERGLTV